MPEATNNRRNYQVWIQVAALLAAGLIFYGITTAKMETHTTQIHNLDETKADKDLVNHQYNELIKAIDNLSGEIKELRDADK